MIPILHTVCIYTISVRFNKWWKLFLVNAYNNLMLLFQWHGLCKCILWGREKSGEPGWKIGYQVVHFPPWNPLTSFIFLSAAEWLLMWWRNSWGLSWLSCWNSLLCPSWLPEAIVRDTIGEKRRRKKKLSQQCRKVMHSVYKTSCQIIKSTPPPL